MGSEGKATVQNRKARTTEEQVEPKCVASAERGIRTGADFAGFMSNLISDVVTRRVTPEVANAACNAGGKMLKVTEMQWRHGAPRDIHDGTLMLAPGVAAS